MYLPHAKYHIRQYFSPSLLLITLVLVVPMRLSFPPLVRPLISKLDGWRCR